MNDLSSLYPPRDRRRGKRWLTKKNVLLAAFGGVLLFITVSYLGEMRHPKGGNFGRLYSARERETPIQAVRSPQVVAEAPIPESAGADPMLLDSARRQQYLGVTTPPPGQQPAPAEPVTTVAGSTNPSPAVPLFKQLKPGQHISISGGSGGLHLEVK